MAGSQVGSYDLHAKAPGSSTRAGQSPSFAHYLDLTDKRIGERALAIEDRERLAVVSTSKRTSVSDLSHYL
jgi:hypothetical protein